MAEYIDREATVAFVKKYSPQIDGMTTLECVERAIKEIPAADVVEVVRCKECKYWQDKNSLGTQGTCQCGDKEMNYGGEFYPLFIWFAKIVWQWALM